MHSQWFNQPCSDCIHARADHTRRGLYCNFFVLVLQVTCTRFSLSARAHYPLLYRVPDKTRPCLARHATTPTCCAPAWGKMFTFRSPPSQWLFAAYVRPLYFLPQVTCSQGLAASIRLFVLPCRAVMPLSLSACLLSRRQGALDC